MKPVNGYIKRPFALIGFSFFITALVCATFGLNVTYVAMPLILSAIILTVLFRFKKRAVVLVVVCITAVSACLCFYSKENYDYLPSQDYVGSNRVIEGTVVDAPALRGGKKCTVKTDSIDGEKVNVKIRVTFSDSDMLDIPEPYEKIKTVARIYGIDNYDKSVKGYYKSEGIYLTAYTTDGNTEFSKLNTFNPLKYIAKFKTSLCDNVLQLMPNDNGGLILALVVGERDYLSDNAISNYKICGISHIFAVSGFHTYIWSTLIFGLLCIFMSKRKSAIFSAIFIVFFMMLTSFTPSVVRAGLMMLCVLSGYILRTPSDSLNSIGLSALIIAIVNPFAVLNTGALLSYSASLGIISCKDFINNSVARIESKFKKPAVKNIANYLVSNALVCLVATISTFPVIVFTLRSLSFLGVVSNILVVGLSMYIMILSGIGLTFMSFGFMKFIGIPFLYLAGVISKLVNRCVSYIAKLDFMYVDISDFTFKIFIVSLFIISAVFYIFKPELLKNKKIIAIAAVNIFLFSIVADIVLKSLNLIGV